MPRPLPLPFKFIAGCLGAALGMTLLIVAAGAFFRPDLSQVPPMPSAAQAAAARQARDARLNPDHPPVIWRDVDYAEGKRGAWWPKGEAPVLAGLVREGKLPPVAERTGPEPIVLEGVEGTGRYGGTWHRLATNPQDLEGVMSSRYSYVTLVRWSPQGYPIVPHLAKSWSASPDRRTWTFTLRQGLRWSDGHPFTTDDILFWWNHEVLYFKSDASNGAGADYTFMRHAGKFGRIERVDDLTLRFVFDEPNGIFLEKLASAVDYFRPAHYLKKYHPEIGDQKLIAETMAAMDLPSAYAVYARMKVPLNPAHPRMWPWIYANYKASAPQVFVRNPYFYAVDAQGNQLPYLDRLVSDIKSKGMVTAAAASGELSYQDRHIDFQDYTLLASEAPRRGYRLLHSFAASRAWFHLSPNLNRAVDPKKTETAWKHRLLNEKIFRQALSLAMRRREISAAVFNGVGEPAQVSPGPDSPYYNERQYHAFTDYDPVRANALLDALGLTRRDHEDFRTFPDGTRMVWFLNVPEEYQPDAATMLADQWAEVGVRALVQVRVRTLWQVEQAALVHDFTVWGGLDEFMAVLQPRYFVPVSGASFFAPMWGRWYQRGGLQGNPEARAAGLEGPPPGHPARRAMELYDLALVAPTEKERLARFNEILEIAADNLWTINLATPPPMLAVVKDGFRNVPPNSVAAVCFQAPGNLGMETYFWDTPNDPPAVAAQIKEALTQHVPLPRASGGRTAGDASPWSGRLLAWGIWLGAVLGLVLLGLRHPFVWRRLLTLVPTLLFISVIVFTLVQLPPGDYVTSKVMELSLNGDPSAAAQVEDIKQSFFYDDPPWKQYARWMGFMWFTSFEAQDSGLLQGNLGRSMERNQAVNEILGDRLLLTMAISFCTILFTWGVALPIGIYSAVRPYTVGDYVLTLLGFVGMSVPPFLFALVLMYFSSEYFGVSVSGLFSVRYASDPVWSWGKLIDLLQHLWVPVIVLGAGSTAVMIRVLRANLLDELKKPYVVAARAKGVRPLRLLLKYPVRMALNPFVSGLAGLFPQLVSGGAIVALVLSLPTVGPLLMLGLMNEDTYFAASMLMVLSVLGVLGTIVSDLLLLWLDPRIRLGGGSR
jgi:ABC-type dipeptide/oligopeptide/nickel transport system permease component/ABC-type transport system substrate-binding protein